MVGSAATWATPQARGITGALRPCKITTWFCALATRKQACAALGPGQAAADGRPLDGTAFVGNTDAETARPGERAKSPCAAMNKFEARRQSMCARDLQAGPPADRSTMRTSMGGVFGPTKSFPPRGTSPLGATRNQRRLSDSFMRGFAIKPLNCI